MRFVAGAATDKGQVRDNNEDAYIVDPRLALFAVADGMGGHQAGEVASATALEALRASIASGSAIGDAVGIANRAVYGKAGGDEDLHGMGTTLTAAMPVGNGIVIGHVGDSRAYLLRDGELRRLTVDHTLVEELVREGKLTKDQAVVHPQRSIVTRALGVEPTVEVDKYALTPTPGDRILLCSDGLSGMLRDEQIAAILRREPDPTRAANALVDAANAAGGEDNVTTVVIDVEIGTADPLPASIAGTIAGVAALAPSADAPDTVVETPAGPVVAELAIPPPGPEPAASAAEAVAHRRDRRRARAVGRGTWRVARWAIPIVLVIGLAVGTVWWFARNTYYVAFDAKGHVTVYQGRPGGLFGWDPTVVRTTELTEDDVGEQAALAIAADKEFATKGDANAYVLQLESRATAATSTTSTTSSTTSTTVVATLPTAPAT
ncbi:MAG: Stp1/IreP family PP2C-type Ser/Thr phosphatase [Actinobacteria bacterium]|nr:Stp1/IreP family PP2C-type Ser/Thr phosphatase [Actinomycetota bacterium]